MKNIILTLMILMSSGIVFAQVGYGLTISNDLYNQYHNPSDDIASPSAGGTILNLGIGPKLWFGSKQISISMEALANWGIITYSSKDKKGFGSLSIPLIGRLNFGGLSGLEDKGKLGFSVGGGLQYNKTELYGLDKEYKDKGVLRDYFQTYILEAALGYGVNGANIQFVVRYGYHPDNDSKSLNIGLQYDFNLNLTGKIDKPASRLY